MLDNQVFYNFISADELLAKILLSLKTCVSVNSSFCGKLVLQLDSPTKVGKRFKVTLRPSLIHEFNLSSFELDNFKFKVLY